MPVRSRHLAAGLLLASAAMTIASPSMASPAGPSMTKPTREHTRLVTGKALRELVVGSTMEFADAPQPPTTWYVFREDMRFSFISRFENWDFQAPYRIEKDRVCMSVHYPFCITIYKDREGRYYSSSSDARFRDFPLVRFRRN